MENLHIDLLYLDMPPYTGAKIAFGRVPERADFQD